MPLQLQQPAFERHDDDFGRGCSSLHQQHQLKRQDPNSYHNFHSDAAYFVGAAFAVVVHVVAELGIDLNDVVDNTVVGESQLFGRLMLTHWIHGDFLKDVLSKEEDEKIPDDVEFHVPQLAVEA